MLRQSSSRGHRSKKLRASHSFQAFLLVAVAIWIVYQLTHAFGERRPVVVETGTGSSNNAGSARRRLGRKGFVHFAGRRASVVDGIAGVSSWSDGSASDDPLSSKAGDGDAEGDEEEREGDEDDDGAADGAVDDADDGLAVAADEEEGDGIDFQSRDGSREDGPKAVQGGGAQNGLNRSVVATVNGTGAVPDGAAVVLSNATVGAADGHGTAPTLSGFASALNNISSVDVASLRDRRTAGDVANSFAVGVPRAEEKPTNTENSGHGIST